MRQLGIVMAVVGLLGMLSGAVADAISVYTFTDLTNGQLSGQDGWQPFSNQNSGGAYDGANRWEISTSLTTYQVARRAATGSGWGSSYHWRQNDENFSTPTFSGTETEAYIQYTTRASSNNGTGTGFGLGYNPDGVDVSESARVMGNLGPVIYVGREDGSHILGFYPAGGGEKVTAALETNATAMVDVRLVMDFTANGGDGSGSIYYRDIGWAYDGSGEWVALEGMQDIALGLLDMNAGAGPASWNAMAIYGTYPDSSNSQTMTNLTVNVPEPATLLLLGLGGVAGLLRRRK